MATSAMRLGLDLDGTLIPEGVPFASGLEPRGIAARLLVVEPLRAGARALLQHAKARGSEVWIYTTSMRSISKIWLQFALHGLRVDGVVNRMRHRDEERRQRASWPSKYPPAFGIDLLIDNEPAMARHGRMLGFEVEIVAADDLAWVDRVMARL